MAAGTVTVNEDRRHSLSRRIKVTFDDGDGTLIISVDRTKSITMQTTGTFDSGTLTVNRSNDGTNFAALGTAIAHTVAAVSAWAAADLGWAYYRFQIASGGASQAVVANIFINE